MGAGGCHSNRPLSFYMKILLTGSTGFIGKRMLPALEAAGHVVVTFDRSRTFLRWIRGPFDAVIHLAWGGVSAVRRNDFDIQTGNVSQFGQMLENCKLEWKPKTFISFGSQAEYGQGANRNEYRRWKMEDGQQYGIAVPECAYGASKAACLNHLALFGWQHPELRWLWLRLFSVYGPGEGPEWFIPSTVRKMRSGEPLLFTPGEQELDYLHVDDVCRAVVAALCERRHCEPNGGHRPPLQNGAYDLGSGKPVKLKVVVDQLAAILKPSQPLQFGALPYRPNQIMRACANTDLWKQLGIQPQIHFTEGLKQTAQAISENADTLSRSYGFISSIPSL